MNQPKDKSSTEIALASPSYPVAAAQQMGGRDLILDAGNLNAIMTVAGIMAESRQAVAKCLRGNKGACMAVAMQAMRWNMDPFALATKVYTTDTEGPISYEGQAIIAALNNSPLLATRLAFRWEGAWEKIIGKFEWRESKLKKDAEGNPKRYLAQTWGDKDEEGLCVIVSALLVGEKEPRELRLYMKQARVRNSPLWVEDPRQQLAYLGGRRWGRIHAPDVIMGVYTRDEISETIDMGMVEEVPVVPPELLGRANDAAASGVAAYQKFWKDCTNLERAQLNELSEEHERLKEEAVAADKRRAAPKAAPPAASSTPAPTAAPAATAAQAADKETGEIDPPEQQQAGGEFVPNYATVLDRMLKAKDRIGVEVAAEWIQDCPENLRAELEQKRDEILAKLPQ